MDLFLAVWGGRDVDCVLSQQLPLRLLPLEPLEKMSNADNWLLSCLRTRLLTSGENLHLISVSLSLSLSVSSKYFSQKPWSSQHPQFKQTRWPRSIWWPLGLEKLCGNSNPPWLTSLEPVLVLSHSPTKVRHLHPPTTSDRKNDARRVTLSLSVSETCAQLSLCKSNPRR